MRALSASDNESALILAMPHDAVASFKGLPFPIAPYKNAVRATDMLTLLDSHYGQREARQDAAQAQIASLQDEVLHSGFIPEQEIAHTLQAYSRTELLASARLLDSDICIYVPGVGLLSHTKLEALRVAVEGVVNASDGKADLDAVSRSVAQALAIHQADVEAFSHLWPQWHVERPSLFEAYLVG